MRTPRAGAIVTNRVLVVAAGLDRRRRDGRRAVFAAAPSRDSTAGWATCSATPASSRRAGGSCAAPPVDGEPDVVTDLGTVTRRRPRPVATRPRAHRRTAGAGWRLRARGADLSPCSANGSPIPSRDDRIECDDLSVLHTVTAWAGRLVGGSRPLAATDLALAEVAAQRRRRHRRPRRAARQGRRLRSTPCAPADDGLAGAARTAPALRAALLAVVRARRRRGVAGGASGARRRGRPCSSRQADEIGGLLRPARQPARRARAAARSVPDDDPVVRQLELAALALGAQPAGAPGVLAGVAGRARQRRSPTVPPSSAATTPR